LASVAAVIVPSGASGFSARIVAPLIGWPVSSFTSPLTRATWAAASPAHARVDGATRTAPHARIRSRIFPSSTFDSPVFERPAGGGRPGQYILNRRSGPARDEPRRRPKQPAFQRFRPLVSHPGALADPDVRGLSRSWPGRPETGPHITESYPSRV